MAENKEQNNGQQQQFVCTGDCLNCHPNQRQYCAAQKGYDNQRLLLEMRESMTAMAAAIKEMKANISEMRNADAQVFAPSGDAEQEPAKKESTGGGRCKE